MITDVKVSKINMTVPEPSVDTDSPAKRKTFGKVLLAHAMEVVEILEALPSYEQEAALAMAKQILVANGHRQAVQSMGSIQEQMTGALSKMFSGHQTEQPNQPVRTGVSWLNEALAEDK